MCLPAYYLGRKWGEMPIQEKMPYIEEARIEKAAHTLKYPDWKYNPSKRAKKNSGDKKGKGKAIAKPRRRPATRAPRNNNNRPAKYRTSCLNAIPKPKPADNQPDMAASTYQTGMGGHRSGPGEDTGASLNGIPSEYASQDIQSNGGEESAAGPSTQAGPSTGDSLEDLLNMDIQYEVFNEPDQTYELAAESGSAAAVQGFSYSGETVDYWGVGMGEGANQAPDTAATAIEGSDGLDTKQAAPGSVLTTPSATSQEAAGGQGVVGQEAPAADLCNAPVADQQLEGAGLQQSEGADLQQLEGAGSQQAEGADLQQLEVDDFYPEFIDFGGADPTMSLTQQTEAAGQGEAEDNTLDGQFEWDDPSMGYYTFQ